mmetsp:Transcript_8289/g.21250  ORF Transcript_8289/g.21250 Transcript_8289/m.21250 type:complete len:239 (-) Transcript_8289:1228-1944(-)
MVVSTRNSARSPEYTSDEELRRRSCLWRSGMFISCAPWRVDIRDWSSWVSSGVILSPSLPISFLIKFLTFVIGASKSRVTSSELASSSSSRRLSLYVCHAMSASSTSTARIGRLIIRASSHAGRAPSSSWHSVGTPSRLWQNLIPGLFTQSAPEISNPSCCSVVCASSVNASVTKELADVKLPVMLTSEPISRPIRAAVMTSVQLCTPMPMAAGHITRLTSRSCHICRVCSICCFVLP